MEGIYVAAVGAAEGASDEEGLRDVGVPTDAGRPADARGSVIHVWDSADAGNPADESTTG